MYIKSKTKTLHQKVMCILENLLTFDYSYLVLFKLCTIK